MSDRVSNSRNAALLRYVMQMLTYYTKVHINFDLHAAVDGLEEIELGGKQSITRVLVHV